MDQVKNFAKATVDGAYESTDTEIDVLTSEGSRFPTPPFNAVWWNATDYPDPSDDPIKEVVRVTAIAIDTLTITRAQEGTAAEDHNEAGKTYKLVAGLTALAWSTLLGDVFGSGTAILVDAVGETIELRQSATKGISIGASTTIEDPVSVDIGDPIGNGNSSFLSISDANQRFSLIGLNLATTQVESATVAVGTLAGKLAIRDGAGDIVGYLPVYTTIT
jgi:hypothetical protein